MGSPLEHRENVTPVRNSIEIELHLIAEYSSFTYVLYLKVNEKVAYFSQNNNSNKFRCEPSIVNVFVQFMKNVENNRGKL